MITTRYTLRCSYCDRVEYKESFDDVNDLLEYAAKDGWVRKKVENGSEWDFCPKCVALEREEVRENRKLKLKRIKKV